jgi:hypothetical protein
LSFIFEETIIDLDYQVMEAFSGDQLILFRFTKPAKGIWVFYVYGKGDMSLSFHMWLPMSGFISENTYFLKSNPYTTLLSIWNAEGVITTTAYDTEDDSLYLNASKGYTRINIVKPEFAAPGVNIQAPNLQKGYTYMTGTSAAAAHTAGVVALSFEWGVVRGNYPDVDAVEIKNFLIRGAQRNPNFIYPNRDWGYGILDLYSSFDALRPRI